MATFRGQRGVALITILIVVAFVSAIATSISKNFTLNKRRTENVLFTDQAFLYVLSAEQLASSMLVELFKASGDKIHLGQEWAQPFMFPLESAGDSTNMLEINLVDAQSCFNLNSILHNPAPANPPNNQPGNPSDPERGDENPGTNPVSGGLTQVSDGTSPTLSPLKASAGQVVFSRLIQQVMTSKGIDITVNPNDLAAAVRDWVDPDTQVTLSNEPPSNGAEDYEYTGYPIPYRAANGSFASKSELRLIKGFSKEIYDAIAPYVCVIPDDGAGGAGADIVGININTIPSGHAELLLALYDDLSLSQAQEILNDPRRNQDGLDQSALNSLLGSARQIEQAQGRVQFTTEYFILNGSATIEGRSSKIVATLKKNGDRFSVVNRHFGED